MKSCLMWPKFVTTKILGQNIHDRRLLYAVVEVHCYALVFLVQSPNNSERWFIYTTCNFSPRPGCECPGQLKIQYWRPINFSLFTREMLPALDSADFCCFSSRNWNGKINNKPHAYLIWRKHSESRLKYCTFGTWWNFNRIFSCAETYMATLH